MIASMRIEDINRDRDKFLQSIQKSLEPELKKIGLVLINVNITDITDESGYIEAIGRKAAVAGDPAGRVDVAEQEKLGEIGVAEAERERAIQVANATKLREIGTREATREQAVGWPSSTRSAGRRADRALEQRSADQGSAAAAGDPHRRARQGAEGRRAAAASSARRDRRSRPREARPAGRGQRQGHRRRSTRPGRHRRVAGRAAGARRPRRTSSARRSKREAEAAVLEAQNRAMAKAALAEAEKVEAEQRAELEAPAKAEKAQDRSSRPRPQPRSAASRPKAQAAAIFAKLEAEARGQYEILAKKGEGLQEDHRRVRRRPAGVPAADARAPRQPGRDVGQGDLEHQVRQGRRLGRRRQRTGPANTSAFLKNMARTMPPMMQVMKDIGGVEMPEFLAKLTGDAPADGKPAPASTNGAVTVPDGNRPV